jgi:hypothetical protein
MGYGGSSYSAATLPYRQHGHNGEQGGMPADAGSRKYYVLDREYMQNAQMQNAESQRMG